MPPAALETPAPSAKDYVELTKPRLSLLSVFTTVLGYFAAKPAWDAWHFIALLAGTSLCAAGVASVNQWMEADTDARMRRTANRPIPSGRMPTGSAFVLGWGFFALGLALLFALVNGAAAFFALMTIVSYLSLYTPAKRWSRWSTELGAVAGAFPPLIGWAAAETGPASLGWVLFALLFFWQIPHFMAIAWIYREDYSEVHFPMLAVRDETGRWVATWSLINTFTSVGAAAAPVVLGLCGWSYLVVTLILGGWFVGRAWIFHRAAQRSHREGGKTQDLVRPARRVFLASVTWLPLQMIALVADRLCSFP